MRKPNLENIVFEDSYLLGWEKSKGTMHFYLELLLAENHPQFTSYDDKSEHGCYKRACLMVTDVDSVAGLPTNVCQPKWNEKTHEYDDVAEIDSVTVTKQMLKIEADEFDIEVCGGNLRVEFD